MSSSERDFLAVAVELAMIQQDAAQALAAESSARNTPPAQLVLQKGLLSASQVDIVDTLTRPTEVIPGYEILDALGQGGMGVVYRALQQNLDRIVALKTVLVSQMSDNHAVARFEQEARSVAKLRHPNIVAAHDFGRHGGRLFFAMEYVEGEDVHQLIAREGWLSEQMTWGLVRQAAAGLAHAAQAGIVHRDIKPANMLLVEAPEGFTLPKGMPMVKIADFGLAYLTQGVEGDSRLTAADTTLGSPHYMSPEQMEGSPVNYQSDIYSLGASAFHMLAGKPPFSGMSLSEVITKKLTRPPPSIRDFRPDVSDATANLIAQMMAREPQRRAAEYHELLARIDAWGQLSSLAGTAPISASITGETAIRPTHEPAETLVLEHPSKVSHSDLAPTVALTKQSTDKVERAASQSKRRVLLWGIGVMFAVLLAAGAFLLVSRRSPAPSRELVPAGKHVPLFDGQDLGTVWLTIVSPWAVRDDTEGAPAIVCTKPTGVVQRQFNDPAHYKVSVQVLLDDAEAAELQCAINRSSDSCLALRITKQGVQFGQRANPRSAFEPLGQLVPIPGIKDRYQVLEFERQPSGWFAVFENRTLVGSAPVAEETGYLGALRLAVENGNAWFSEVELDALVSKE